MYDLLCDILGKAPAIQTNKDDDKHKPNKGVETMLSSVFNLQDSFTA
jgi:hypothetical protein